MANGKDAGQAVFHMHVKAPRSKNWPLISL